MGPFFHLQEDRDTIRIMIMDGIPATHVPENATLAERAVASFLKFIERRLGVSIIRDIRGIPEEQTLLESLYIAALLRNNGIIKEFGRSVSLPDEPRIKSWYAVCNDATSHHVGGAGWESDSDALRAALAEALERYIWFTEEDYFVSPRKATVAGIGKIGRFVAPEKFAGFSDEQRVGNPERQLREDTEYLWIQGTSLVQGKNVYIPAQVVSGIQNRRHRKEPSIRHSTTNGLATWPTQNGARLAGALELIEREAYMVMWLNQLTLPRVSLAPLCARYPSFARNVAACERYRLKMHAILLLTDAPAYAVAVVLQDMSGIAPRFTIGLKAHRSLPLAIQKAAIEALRAHRGYRFWSNTGNTWDTNTPLREVGHRERLYYWGVPEHAKKLEFLIQGPEVEMKPEQWENDSEEEQLQRITRWCAGKGFECISVSLGTSSKNPTPLHIEMVVMPELQPTYLAEPTQAFGGMRWRDVPKAFGYTPLQKPFADAPHPFS